MGTVEDKVDSAQYFIDELPAGDYALQQLASLGAAYSTHFLTMGRDDGTNLQGEERR